MIQKQELRIGNSVMCEGKILTVKAIEHNPVTDRWYVKVYENYSQIKCEYLEPIPITEEALVKCGFEQDIFGDYANENIYELLLQIDLISCRISVNSDDRRVDFEGIHNLQNYIYINYQTELSYD